MKVERTKYARWSKEEDNMLIAACAMRKNRTKTGRIKVRKLRRMFPGCKLTDRIFMLRKQGRLDALKWKNSPSREIETSYIQGSKGLKGIAGDNSWMGVKKGSLKLVSKNKFVGSFTTQDGGKVTLEVVLTPANGSSFLGNFFKRWFN